MRLVPVGSKEELPIQGTIKKTVYYGYELEENYRSGPGRKREANIRPVIPAFMRDSHAVTKMRQAES